MNLLTAQETVDYFESFATHYYGPTTTIGGVTYTNQYNGKYYGNPFTVSVGRATKDGPGEYYCADAVTDSLRHAGIDIRKQCKGFYNCGALYNYMWTQPGSGKYGFHTVNLDDATTGDVTLLWFNGMWGHVFMHRAPNSGGNMHNIEGDTSNAKWPGSSTVGGVTTVRERSLAAWRGHTHTFRPTGYAAPPPPLPILALGDTGDHVANLQTGLNKVLTLVTDGQFGPNTAAAVKDFQGRANLTVDGVVGAKTAAALKALGVTL